MYITVKTHDVWVITDEFLPARFFAALGCLVSKGDVIAFGAYEPSDRAMEMFERMNAAQKDISKVYFGSFDLNRGEHPRGRSFEVEVTDGVLSILAEMSGQNYGQKDKPLFFDHVLAYRRGSPVLPIFCYHDAFSGGPLYISGLFEQESIRAFSTRIGASYTNEFNPEFRKETGV
jgi:hypothetical protein